MAAAKVGETALASSTSSHRCWSSRDAPPTRGGLWEPCSPTRSASGGAVVRLRSDDTAGDARDASEEDFLSGVVLGAATFSSSASRFRAGVRSVQDRARTLPPLLRFRERGGEGENLDGEPEPRLAGQGVPAGPGSVLVKRFSSSRCALASSRRSWWIRSSSWRSAMAAGLLPLLILGQFVTLFARPAKRSEERVSEMCWLLGEQATRSAVRQLPPRDSSSRRVSRESR
mmetsp:Transcript_18403/g.40427  ORF Transcript_18403/g.40427 Transcript_18403/m.40427 type:complete len:229 (-) Transcript_18403:1172-1858(-)